MIAQYAQAHEQHRFDVGALERYLRERVPGFAGPLKVRQFRGGSSNPTYHLIVGAGEYVLRRKPPGKLLHGRVFAGPALPQATPAGRTSMCHGGRRGNIPKPADAKHLPGLLRRGERTRQGGQQEQRRAARQIQVRW